MAEIIQDSWERFNIFLVGNPNDGKSTFCNFLFREERFDEHMPIMIVRDPSTLSVNHGVFNYKSTSISLYDCPGMSFQGHSYEVYEIISEAGERVNNKVDAFAFPIRLSTRLHIQPIYNFLNTFGNNFWDYVFIVFTNEQIITENEKEPVQPGGREFVEEWLKEYDCHPTLIKVMDRIKKRYICVESKDWNDNEDYWNGKCQEFVEMLNKIREENNGESFDHTQLIGGLELFKQETQERERRDELHNRIQRARTRIRDLNRYLSQPDPVIPLYDIVTSPSLFYLWVRGKLIRHKKSIVKYVGGSIPLFISFVAWEFLESIGIFIAISPVYLQVIFQ